MSFIIQGVDLPKGYKALHMRVQSDGVVRYVIEGDDPVHIIDGACAIQIPKGHGDIKDVGNIIKKFDENIALAEAKPMVMYADAFLNDALEWSAEYITIKDDIDNAPTILEAEE